jgi:hypothetical protein
MGNPPSGQFAPGSDEPAIKAGVRTYWQRMLAALARTGLLAPKEAWRAAFSRLWSYGSHKQEPPARELAPDRVVYGLSQPLFGLRMLLSDPEILREALVPAAWLGAFCAVVATFSHDGTSAWGWVKAFYKTFAVLAPVPSIIFAKHYARLAALVRWRLGFGACGPRELPMAVSLKRAIQQVIIVAIGVLPFALVGLFFSKLIVLVWGVHWVVVDAFDDARVLLPGETIRSAEAADRQAPPPWYVRWFLRAADRLPVIGGPLRAFARLCDRLSMPWREEINLMESNPLVALGFALSTATLLATPVLNLLFRPIILVGSSHLLGHLEAVDPSQHPQLPAPPRERKKRRAGPAARQD